MSHVKVHAILISVLALYLSISVHSLMRYLYLCFKFLTSDSQILCNHLESQYFIVSCATNIDLNATTYLIKISVVTIPFMPIL